MRIVQLNVADSVRRELQATAHSACHSRLCPISMIMAVAQGADQRDTGFC